MNRLDFLHTLYHHMEGLPETVRREVLENYKEHYRLSLEKGEPEDQIAVRLGDPSHIADRIRKDPRTATELHKAATSGTVRIQGSVEKRFDPQTPYAPYEQSNRTQWNNRLKGLSLVTLLFFINLVFVLGPWLAVAGILIGLWGAAIGMTIGGLAGAAAYLMGPWIPWIGAFTGGLSATMVIAGCVVVTSLGVLLIILALVLSKWFFRLTALYADWTIQIMLGRKPI